MAVEIKQYYLSNILLEPYFKDIFNLKKFNTREFN